MNPYYEHGGITIYLGDAREVLPNLPRFDLLCTDPPYGIGVARKSFGSGRIRGGGIRKRHGQAYQPTNFGDATWDDRPASRDLIDLARASARQQLIWGGNYFHLPPSMRWLVWDKCCDGTDFSDCELAWTNMRQAARIFRWRWNGMLQEYGGRFKEARLHPAMKPLALMTWCLGLFPDARTVIDPFMGSGTTLVAAKRLGLTATGVEIDERYCAVAVERLAQEVLNFQSETAQAAGEVQEEFVFADTFIE